MKIFKFLTLCIASAVWAGVSCLIDRWTHNFGFAFICGALAAICCCSLIGVAQEVVRANQFERDELRRIAEEKDRDSK